MKTITIILTDGPYISEYAEMAYKIAKAALKKYQVNIFLYLDAVHIPKIGQSTRVLRQRRRTLPGASQGRGQELRHAPDVPMHAAIMQQKVYAKTICQELRSLAFTI